MRVIERFRAYGHPNITARNKTTFELTKERRLTKRGDCIVAVGAEKGASELGEAFKILASKDESRITASLRVAGYEVVVSGYGSRRLSFLHPTDMVGRKSDFTCGRTLLIRADKAAADFPREFVEALQDRLKVVEVELVVEV
ncbi:MAG: DUF371 domain-containing protein [Candidatus Bathyarchaeia archaeon]